MLVLHPIIRRLWLTTLLSGTSVFANPSPSPLANSFAKLMDQQELTVVVVGNSVTAGAPEGQSTHPSFYIKLAEWLRATFPEAEIKVVPKIIYAIGPEVQLFYLDDRVLAENPDLVIAEFGAANGAWGLAGMPVTSPASEGWIRRLREKSPNTDVILMMGLFKTMMNDYEKGHTPPSAAFLHQLADHYEALPVDAGRITAEKVIAGAPWSTYMKDHIHPSAGGYALYSEVLIDRVDECWQQFKNSPQTAAHPHSLPEATIHPAPWKVPSRIPASAAETHEFEEQESNGLQYLHAETLHAHGIYRAPESRQVVGLLMHENRPDGNLEVRHPDGHWVRLGQQSEPHFTIREDPKNRLFRVFFQAYGLQAALTEVNFRVSTTPEDSDGRNVDLVYFFETEVSH